MTTSTPPAPPPATRPHDGDAACALAALDGVDPALRHDHANRVAAARAAVLGRLWGALWREGVDGSTRRVTADRAGRQEAVVSLPDGRELAAPVVAAEPFGAYPTGLAVRVAPGLHVDDPVALLDALGLDDVDGRVSRLRDELGASVVGLALARAAEDRRRADLARGLDEPVPRRAWPRRRSLRPAPGTTGRPGPPSWSQALPQHGTAHARGGADGRSVAAERAAERADDRADDHADGGTGSGTDGRSGARPGPAGGVLGWARDRAARHAAFRPLAFFEQLAVDGHPLHPCCRTRTGMSVGEQLAFAPEWGRLVAVAVVAVRRDRYTGRGDLTALLRGEHPAVTATALAALPEPDRYALLPVHPWQVRHVLRTGHDRAVADGSLVVLPGRGIPAHPLMSLRTLAPAGGTVTSHLKTALDVQMTSAVRAVSPTSVHNGPLLSRMLGEIARRERDFGGRFRVLADYASGCYVDPDAGPSARLAAIAREPAERYAGPGELVMPVAALSARSPFGDRTVLSEAVELSGMDGGAWLAAYAELVLPPFLTLLTRWGVALEAHGQNTLVVLRDGRPVRVLYRDLGGVRVCARRLARQGLRTPPLRGAVPTGDPEVLRAKLAASLLATHLAGVVATLARDTGTAQPVLWGVVAAAVRKVYAGLGAEPEAAADERALFADTAPVKAMLSMRLAADPLADRWVHEPNPLAAAR